MRITVDRNFPPLAETVLVTAEDWMRIGRLARERIVTRTAQSLDIEGSRFAPYSASYAAQRTKEGMDTVVRLEVSGQMMNGIVVVPDADGVTLKFNG